MRKVLIMMILALTLTGCTALTPWGSLNDGGNRIIAIQTAEMQIITARTDGPEAATMIGLIMEQIKEVFNKGREIER